MNRLCVRLPAFLPLPAGHISRLSFRSEASRRYQNNVEIHDKTTIIWATDFVFANHSPLKTVLGTKYSSTNFTFTNVDKRGESSQHFRHTTPRCGIYHLQTVQNIPRIKYTQEKYQQQTTSGFWHSEISFTLINTLMTY